MKKRYWLIIITLAIIAVIFIFKKNNNDSFLTYTVIKQDISDELFLAGTIDAKKRVDLGFASSGRIKKVNYQIGDVVKKGSVIAEIEQNRLSADLAQAQANFTLARVETITDISSAKESLEKQIREQNILVEGLYEEYLSGDLQAYNVDDRSRTATAPVISGNYTADAEGEYFLDIYNSGAESGFSFVLSGLEKGTFTAENQKPGKLGNNGLFIEFNPLGSYGNSEWVIPVPNNRSDSYNSRRRAYETAKATRDRVIAELENNVDRVSGIDSESQISRDDARRAQAKAQVSSVVAQLGDGKIRAPFDGIIVRNNLEIGEIISAFTPLITVFADDTRKLQLNTPEIYINKIAEGDTVSIKLDAYPDEKFIGIVDFIDVIDTEVDGVPVYQTDIILQDNDPRIRAGMNAKASIIAEERLGVIAVPNHYISLDANGISRVLVKSADSTRGKSIIVETGFRGNDGLIEIISGLNEGDIILVEKE